MEPRLAKHSATPNKLGNHFSPEDMASRKRLVGFWSPTGPMARSERAERMLSAKISHARRAGRAMFRCAQYWKALEAPYLRERDILEMLLTPGSRWMEKMWRKELVHKPLIDLAAREMRRQLVLAGWNFTPADWPLKDID